MLGIIAVCVGGQQLLEWQPEQEEEINTSLFLVGCLVGE